MIRTKTRGARPGGDGVVVALDIGATKTLLAVRALDAGGTDDDAWHHAATVRFATERDPAAQVERVTDAARSAAAGRPIVAIGCAVPGPLDRATGRVHHSPNLGWHDLALGALLAERSGAPVAVEDDAAAGALGEWRFGAGRDADPFAFVTVSSGVGSGVVVGGRALHGSHGFAGEIGHLAIDPDGPRCGCGRRGHVEAYVGGAALARRTREAWPAASAAVAGLPVPREAAAVFRAARAGDPVAAGLVEEAAEALGHALAAIAAVLDPARIAVGGAIGLGQPAFVRRAAAIARRRCIEETGRAMTVVRAELGDQSALAGALVIGAGLARGARP